MCVCVSAPVGQSPELLAGRSLIHFAVDRFPYSESCRYREIIARKIPTMEKERKRNKQSKQAGCRLIGKREK